MKWLSVIGLGEEGARGLSPLARKAIERAEITIGGKRHHALVPNFNGKRVAWPQPFRLAVEEFEAYRGKQVAVLVTGDPLWYSAGCFLAQHFSDEVAFFPQLSAFQWVAARVGWPLAGCETLTAHGRAIETILPSLSPQARLLVLTDGADAPARIGQLLRENGFGESVIHMFAHIGGTDEHSLCKKAHEWEGCTAPALNTLAIECRLDAGAYANPRIGLDDEAFEHDGKMTKREIRALTLVALAPRRGQLLWDIGAGCGSVGIEWMRAGQDMRAVGVEISEARRKMALHNAKRLGASGFEIFPQPAPEALKKLPPPNAVFIGGGLSTESADISVAALKAGGRLVANSVTVESEILLSALHQKYGGRLLRLSVSRAEAVGNFHGWKPFMPITQWIFVKAGGA